MATRQEIFLTELADLMEKHKVNFSVMIDDSQWDTLVKGIAIEFNNPYDPVQFHISTADLESSDIRMWLNKQKVNEAQAADYREMVFQRKGE